ncbi:MAG TPA: hypothetical protein VJ761_02450 [Ktedonobacteraceae bacterium]|nr:hypothetical protein [Ktedonobacteraceae bacterium]
MQRFTSRPEPEPDPPSNITFQAYLQQHQLNPLDVALASGVRYATVWNIAHNYPVRAAHAALVRAGLQRLTGVPYTTAMALLPSAEQPSDKRKRR